MIYCVEDDQGIRDLMIYTLKAAGYEAKGLAEGAELEKAMAEGLPELILLDIMLPGEDGITILKKLREDPQTAGIPVIMASAKGTEYDKVIGLDSGADDYLAKPFGMMEMLARVRAVLRRMGRTEPDKDSQQQDEEILRSGEITLDNGTHSVSVSGEIIRLTLKEYELLHLFLRNQGRAFTREQLLDAVWGIDYVGESRTVDVHIGTLRNKLGACGTRIETVRGVGYRMEKN